MSTTNGTRTLNHSLSGERSKAAEGNGHHSRDASGDASGGHLPRDHPRLSTALETEAAATVSAVAAVAAYAEENRRRMGAPVSSSADPRALSIDAAVAPVAPWQEHRYFHRSLLDHTPLSSFSHEVSYSELGQDDEPDYE